MGFQESVLVERLDAHVLGGWVAGCDSCERERDLLEGSDDFNGHIAGGGADDE